MASAHDLDLVARIRAGDASGLLIADDPEEVAESVTRMNEATVAVDVDDLPAAVAAARVRLAELVVARATRVELEGVGASPSRAPDNDRVAGRDADRQAVRFALVILVPALAGGVAVYLADGLVLAPALPAAALAALGGVVLAHRGPSASASFDRASEVTAHPPTDVDSAPTHVDSAPAVRAAEAHLRRQQAAWKLVWWERSEPVPDLDSWSPRIGATVPITLVSVDASRRFDAGAHAATAPAAVRVVVLQAR